MKQVRLATLWRTDPNPTTMTDPLETGWIWKIRESTKARESTKTLEWRINWKARELPKNLEWRIIRKARDIPKTLERRHGKWRQSFAENSKHISVPLWVT